jgi:copper(I)-binding protein
MLRQFLFALVAGGLVGAGAHAADMPMAGGIAVSDAWSRATSVASVPGVVYLTITDTGMPDRLTGASTPVAASASLHQTRSENGVDRMLPVDGVDVSAGTPLSFAPGGYHIMLMGLKQPLKAGDEFSLTLSFVHAGPVTTTVTVRATQGKDTKSMDHMDHM